MPSTGTNAPVPFKVFHIESLLPDRYVTATVVSYSHYVVEGQVGPAGLFVVFLVS